jgi:chemotaxis protein MotB
VAYADFVTAMMAFFLVMWITAQSKPIKESVANYFNDPFGGPTTRPNGTSYQRSYDGGDAPYSKGVPKIAPHRAAAAPKKKPRTDEPRTKQARRPSVFTLHSGDRSHVGAVLLFPEKSAELDSRAQERLDTIIPIMRGKPNKIEIRGHATRRPISNDGTFGNPWELCFARCQATLDYLVSQGISPDRVRLSQAGPYEPQAVDTAQNDENSRVEVYMLGEFVEDLQGDGSRTAAGASAATWHGPTPDESEAEHEDASHH